MVGFCKILGGLIEKIALVSAAVKVVDVLVELGFTGV